MNLACRQIILAILMIGAALSLAGLAPSTARAAVARGRCALSKTKYVIATDTVSTSSTSFVAVPDSKVKFTQSATGCVIVHLSAEAASFESNAMEVRAVLDGGDAKKVGNEATHTSLTRGDSGRNDRERTFIFVDVSAGAHFVELQYFSENGGDIFLNVRTIIVQYQ